MANGTTNWLLTLALSVGAVVPAALPVYAQTCPCKPTPSGGCQRWHSDKIMWSTYMGEGKPTVSDMDFERAATSAFDAWGTVSCDVCMKPDSKTKGCRPDTCPANPIGLNPVYQGRSPLPKLATACGGVYCPDAGPGTAQVAIIRDVKEWPLGTTVVTAPVLTITKAGEIVDADVLFFDNGHVFCVTGCTKDQYDIGGALMQEIGHFLGVGYSDQTLSVLAANFNPGAKLNPTLSTQDTHCVCQIYRSADNQAECLPKTATDTGDCTAAPGSRELSGHGNFGLLVLAGAALTVVGWRRRQARAVVHNR